MTFTCVRSITAVFILFFAAQSEPEPGVSGNWRGTFKSMLTGMNPDGSYPETVNKFQLSLRETGGVILGRFAPLSPGLAPAQEIRNGRRFGSRYCFDIMAAGGDDLRWCVTARGNRLIGVWNRGPEGGPMQDGLGTGTRLFRIAAKRNGAAPN